MICEDNSIVASVAPVAPPSDAPVAPVTAAPAAPVTDAPVAPFAPFDLMSGAKN